MIDAKYNVRRYIAEYSERNEDLLAEHELSSFDLEKFQEEFGETDPKNPMFDCYPIKESNTNFLKQYVDSEPVWDFEVKSYFIEAHAI
jgi:hypothetical protein